MARSPSYSRVDSARSWAAMVSQPMRSSSSMAVPKATAADHVGRAGLLALGRIGPDHLVEVDQVDRAAAGEERVAVSRTSRRGPISAPAPKGA